MEDTRLAVAHTGLLVAAMRAEESARRDRLFTDPFAERLAGDEGRELLAQAVAKTGATSPQIAIRTRFWDERLLRAQSDGISQVVILAAGMDARAYRLPWQPGTTVYEVDQPRVTAIRTNGSPASNPGASGLRWASIWPTIGRRRCVPRGFRRPHRRCG